jgi:hypothetical protein
VIPLDQGKSWCLHGRFFDSFSLWLPQTYPSICQIEEQADGGEVKVKERYPLSPGNAYKGDHSQWKFRQQSQSEVDPRPKSVEYSHSSCRMNKSSHLVEVSAKLALECF